MFHAFDGQRRESKFGAAARQRFDDAGDVVADEDEAGDFGIGFDDAAERRLGVAGDGVGLVQYDDFEWRVRIGFFGRGGVRGCGVVFVVIVVVVVIFLFAEEILLAVRRCRCCCYYYCYYYCDEYRWPNWRNA